MVALSPSWKERFEGRNDPTAGAGAAGEANALRSLWAQDQTAFRDKLVLVILPMMRGENLVPVELHGVQCYTVENFTNEALEPLLRLLTSQPAYPLRPLGAVPRLAPAARIPDVVGSPGPQADRAPSAEPSPDQIDVLNAILDEMLDAADLPSFRVMDKKLDLQGQKLREVALSMPPGLMRPDMALRPHVLRDDDRLSVTLDGLAYCRSGAAALNLLGRALAYLADRERPFIPSDDRPYLTVTSAEIRQALDLSGDEISPLLTFPWVIHCGSEGQSPASLSIARAISGVGE